MPAKYIKVMITDQDGELMSELFISTADPVGDQHKAQALVERGFEFVAESAEELEQLLDDYANEK